MNVIKPYVFDPKTHHQEADWQGNLITVPGGTDRLLDLSEITSLAMACFNVLRERLPHLSLVDQEPLRAWHRAVVPHMKRSAEALRLTEEEQAVVKEIFQQMDRARMEIFCSLSSIPRWRQQLVEHPFDDQAAGEIIRGMCVPFREESEPDWYEPVRDQVLKPGSEHRWLDQINEWLEINSFDVDHREEIIGDLNDCLFRGGDNLWQDFMVAMWQRYGEAANDFIGLLMEMMQQSYEVFCTGEDGDDLAEAFGKATLA